MEATTMACHDETTELFGTQDDAVPGHYCNSCGESFQDEEAMLPVKELAPMFDAVATGQTANPSMKKPRTNTAHQPSSGASHVGQHRDTSSQQTTETANYAPSAFQVNPRRCHCNRFAIPDQMIQFVTTANRKRMVQRRPPTWKRN
ncbi:hypothetical protein SEMRO_1745_G294920.1 [Seminavis robusta]|uniref:Uncharacterized protein n=1 Tax=Seminavis robusta TaxID=568900 RepID=A0A9N8HUG0_9STRA|nr:hypothetical protein SEMRO_1745_G294920.1 [Seminavis robusta]|eukprot:Sro1745_g294920.1 n/a (146) ;mRNA; f:2825-3262